MVKNSVSGWASVKDGVIYVGEKRLQIPNFTAVREVGRGANAVVFEAVDALLGRQVAIKVWNNRGQGRAQFETAKIAKLNHPLVVGTYMFGSTQDHPYCIMEFVPGTSGKAWIKESRSIQERTLIWELYSRALRFIHDNGAFHGDPHLGNVLIFQDPNEVYSRNSRWPYAHSGWGIKIADTGTSEFWRNYEKILQREAELTFETASRLFHDQNIDQLWFKAGKLNYKAMLETLDVLCEYVFKVNTWIDWDARSANADQLVEMLAKAPLFEIEAIVAQISKTGYTGAERFYRRLNAHFSGEGDILRSPTSLLPRTLELYNQARQAFLNENRA